MGAIWQGHLLVEWSNWPELPRGSEAGLAFEGGMASLSVDGNVVAHIPATAFFFERIGSDEGVVHVGTHDLNVRASMDPTSGTATDVAQLQAALFDAIRTAIDDEAGPSALPVWGASSKPPATLIRGYEANSLVDATRRFRKEAATLSDHGYAPSSQSWAAADRTGALVGSLLGGATALFGILFLGGLTTPGIIFLIVGVAIAVVAVAASPSGGTLTVTYLMGQSSIASAEPAPMAVAPAAGQQAVRERLGHLGELHRDGIVTDEEYAARRGEILKEI